MRDFFKPWRRKIGVVTLGMACAFAAMWVRSLFAHDSVGFPLNRSTVIGVLSASNSLIFCIQYREDIGDKWTVTKWATRFDPLDVDGITWFAGLAGFGIGRVIPCQRTSGIDSMILTVPYWSLVGLSLLFSPYLLQPEPLAQPKADTVSWSQVIIIVVAIIIALVIFSAPAVQ